MEFKFRMRRLTLKIGIRNTIQSSDKKEDGNIDVFRTISSAHIVRGSISDLRVLSVDGRGVIGMEVG